MYHPIKISLCTMHIINRFKSNFEFNRAQKINRGRSLGIPSWKKNLCFKQLSNKSFLNSLHFLLFPSLSIYSKAGSEFFSFCIQSLHVQFQSFRVKTLAFKYFRYLFLDIPLQRTWHEVAKVPSLSWKGFLKVYQFKRFIETQAQPFFRCMKRTRLKVNSVLDREP